MNIAARLAENAALVEKELTRLLSETDTDFATELEAERAVNGEREKGDGAGKIQCHRQPSFAHNRYFAPDSVVSYRAEIAVGLYVIFSRD